MTAFTVILPHRRTPINDKSLALAIDCLLTNTDADFHLLTDAAYNQPLIPRINALVANAPTDCVVYWSSDQYAAPGWDTAFLGAWTPDTLVTGVVVEPGVMGCHPDNVNRDYGRLPDTFDRARFENDATGGQINVPSGIGFPSPLMLSRSRFLELGGYKEEGLAPDHQGFTGADTDFIERWLVSGRTTRRASGFVYHMQRLSEPEEASKPARFT